jgi:uncharacterized Zn-binding protein involved in type VI secretion
VLRPAAKQNDRVVAIDTHLVQPPGPSSPVPTPHPFSGIIDGGLHDHVLIDGLPAATVGSTASNKPSHVPSGGTFVTAPTNRAEIVAGSTTVFINGKAAGRAGDTARTCNDPVPMPIGRVVVTSSTVMIGG